MHIEFLVKGRPPKKGQGWSMWGTDDEAPLVASLRGAAREAQPRYGIRGCFPSLVDLEIAVFVPEDKLESIGDLDNFITGVCDGLQKADCQATIHKIFKEPGRERIDPSLALLIKNDAKVVSIVARKVTLAKGCQETYYTVKVRSAKAPTPQSYEC